MESGLCFSVSVSVLSIWETLNHLVVSVGWKELGVLGFTCSCQIFLSEFRNGGSSPRKGFRIISLEFLRNRILSLPVFSEIVRLEAGGEGGKMNLRYYSHLFTLSNSSRMFFISLYFLCCEAWWNVKVVSQSCYDLQERIDVGTENTYTPTYTSVCAYANSAERMKYMEEAASLNPGEPSVLCVCVILQAIHFLWFTAAGSYRGSRRILDRAMGWCWFCCYWNKTVQVCRSRGMTPPPWGVLGAVLIIRGAEGARWE